MFFLYCSVNTPPPPQRPTFIGIKCLFNAFYPILMRCKLQPFHLKIKGMKMCYFFYRVRLNL